MLHSLCLLHLYHPLPSLSAECRWKTQEPRIISSFLGTEMEFGVLSVSTCWGRFAAVVESTCQYCWLPFINGLCWRDSGRVVVWSETGALCQSNINYLWTEVHAHPKEQVIVSGSFWFLPKSVVKGGGEEQAMPNRWLPHVQASVRLQTELEKSLQNVGPGISIGTGQEMTGASKSFGAGHFPSGPRDWIETLGLPI